MKTNYHMAEVKLFPVYQAVEDRNDGCETPSWAYFAEREQAVTFSKPGTWSGNGHEPIEHMAIEMDGDVYLLSSPITLHRATDNVDRDTALAKLTDRERQLLGLKGKP